MSATVASVSNPVAQGAHGQRDAGPQRAKIAVLGASGYSGQEFTRLALVHPGLEIVALCSRELAGQPAAALLPGFDSRGSALPDVLAPDAVAGLLEAGVCDTVIACLPHQTWRKLTEVTPALGTAPARVIDLSSDHREGDGGYIYGLPEAFRATIASATRIANPGCYATTAALALLPALAAGWVAGPVMVSALSGVSGAGRAASLRTSFAELDGGAAMYKAGEGHPHVAEMARTLATLGTAVPVAFVPHLVPMARGIVLTASAVLDRAVSPQEAHAAYAARYQDEPFVRVLEPGTWPETRTVRGSNRCDVAVTTVHGGTTLLATAALDNLVKGAAGQAIQNFNLMLGWPEATGLPVSGTPW